MTIQKQVNPCCTSFTTSPFLNDTGRLFQTACHYTSCFKSFKVIQNTSAPVLAGRKQVLPPISTPGGTSTQACKKKLRNMLLTFLAQHLQRSSWNIIGLGSLQGTHFLLPHSNHSFLRTSGFHFFSHVFRRILGLAITAFLQTKWTIRIDR